MSRATERLLRSAQSRLRLAALALLAPVLGSAPALACTQLKSYPFEVTTRQGNVVILVGHVDDYEALPVAFAANLRVTQDMVSDVQASLAAGCTQSINHYADANDWAWNDAAGGHRATVAFSLVRAANGKRTVLKGWTDSSSVGPFPAGGEGSDFPVYMHQLPLTKKMVRSVVVNDVVEITGSGEVWAAAYAVSVFNQAYGSYGYGAAFVLPTLDIWLP